jgi:hypothetical protein
MLCSQECADTQTEPEDAAVAIRALRFITLPLHQHSQAGSGGRSISCALMLQELAGLSNTFIARTGMFLLTLVPAHSPWLRRWPPFKQSQFSRLSLSAACLSVMQNREPGVV